MPADQFSNDGQITIGSLLHGLTDQERAELYISVLIAQTDPTHHPNWNERWLREAVDSFFTYDVNATQLAYLRRLEETEHYTEKGVFDYLYALRQCYDTGASYVGMFEDDVILAHGWLIRTLQGLHEIPDSTQEHPAWLFMRLFNQERSIGWASRAIGGNNEYWIILGAGLGTSAVVLFTRQRWRFSRRYLDLGTLFVVVLILVPGLVVLFFQSGKASLLPHSPGVFNEPFGCCSQAMIFPRAQVPLLARSLQERKEGQIDLMLDDIASSNKLERYALYPVQAQHIGIDSARKTAKEEAQAIWSMAFEDLKPKELERDHQKMVNEYKFWKNQV
ncbi:unnamed protein product [Clonostachys rosea]|uniref:Glycosyltransferase 2-like domain-containing protein n=1 Tax=Bionectria ochroleuca TaxID=29856 RepID=A0ABY6TR75_BIOOC|nr:unnamed protein product [Clonostachys rosea]